MTFSEDHNCHCDDPKNPAQKLWLCGTELCKHLTNKAYRNGHSYLPTLIIDEDSEQLSS